MSAAFTYRKEIDGLRALAVLPVLFFHAGFEIFSGGFTGVDIFFVISGYLITSILINEMQADKFSLLQFYERRARRILPALCVVMLASFAAAYAIMLPDQWKAFLQSSVAVIFFASNIFFWLEDDYFAAVSEEKPLLHSWSLAVEEQYYIIFPILLMVMWRFGRNPMLYVIGFLALISLISAQWGSRYHPSANFYLLFGRAWEILAGALAAFYMARTPKVMYIKYHNIWAWGGFVMLVISIFIFDKDTPFPSLYALLPVIGTVLILVFADGKKGIGFILSQPLLVGVGLISYSLYLWHQPVFAFGRLLLFDMGWIMKIALIGLSIILAIMSYYWIEKPARRDWFKNTTPLVFFTKAAIVPGCIILCSILFLWQKWSPYNPSEGQAYAGADIEWNYSSNIGASAKGRLILYGDSHARQYAPSVESFAARNDYNFKLLAHPACISFPELTNHYQGKVHDECIGQWEQLYSQHQKDDVIMIAHRWGPILSDLKGNIIGKIGEENSDDARKAIFDALRLLIGKFDPKQRFIVVGNVPGAFPASAPMERGPARCSQYINVNCTMSYTRKDGELYDFNQAMRQYLKAYPNAAFIDPYDSLCDNEKCYVGRGKDIYYSDAAHLTHSATEIFLRNEKQILRSILNIP